MMTIGEGNSGGGGDDGVRERSPLHEVGERAWPCGGEDSAADSPESGGGSRAKFRLRVGRRGGPNSGGSGQRGPLVRICLYSLYKPPSPSSGGLFIILVLYYWAETRRSLPRVRRSTLSSSLFPHP